MANFSEEEKQRILEKLNQKRIIDQKASRGIDGKKATYTKEEKQKILEKLNEHRTTTQKREEIEDNRSNGKKIFQFEGKEYFKLKGMEREYFILEEDAKKASPQPKKINLYYQTFAGMKKKEVLMKIEGYSEQFFISYNLQRLYYKGYFLLDEF